MCSIQTAQAAQIYKLLNQNSRMDIRLEICIPRDQTRFLATRDSIPE